MTAKATKEFVVRLFDSDTTVQGAHDYYVIMLVFDILCFVTIVLGVSSFGVSVHGHHQLAIIKQRNPVNGLYRLPVVLAYRLKQNLHCYLICSKLRLSMC